MKRILTIITTATLALSCNYVAAQAQDSKSAKESTQATKSAVRELDKASPKLAESAVRELDKASPKLAETLNSNDGDPDFIDEDSDDDGLATTAEGDDPVARKRPGRVKTGDVTLERGAKGNAEAKKEAAKKKKDNDN